MMSNRLADHHRAELERSGISQQTIDARAAYTAYRPEELQALGFADYQALAPALVLPVHSVNGWADTYYIKPDRPRTPPGKVKPLKYEYPAGAANRLDVPRNTAAVADDPTIPVMLTEGIKKVDAAVTAGYHIIGLGGVWNWLGKHDTPASMPIPDFGYFVWKGRKVAIVFDSDVAVNKNVREARRRLKLFLESLGAIVVFIDLPTAADGSKVGLDDYLVANPDARLWDMAYDPEEEKFAAMQRKLDEVQKELSDAREEYRWQRDLDSVPNKLLSGADKLALRDLRRATKRAGDAAYREPQTLFYGERTRHTGQSKQTYGAAVKRAEEMGAVKIVKGNYESSGKPKISVVLCDAFKQPARLARPEPSKAGGARPKNVPICDGCGPDAGVREDKTTTTKYYCTGPDCGVLLHEVITAPARVHLVRDPAHPGDCYPPETATVPYLERKVEGETPSTQSYPVRSKYGTVSDPPEQEPGYWESLTALPPATIRRSP